MLSHAQSISHTSILFKQHLSLMKNTGDMAINSASFRLNVDQPESIDMRSIGDDDYKKSRRYKNGLTTRNEGIGLLSAAGACLIGGPPLLAAGIRGLINDQNAPSSLNNNAPDLALAHMMEVMFGALFTGAGVGMSIPGAILLPKGLQRMKKAKQAVNEP
jgi:hypothetical protein